MELESSNEVFDAQFSSTDFTKPQLTDHDGGILQTTGGASMGTLQASQDDGGILQSTGGASKGTLQASKDSKVESGSKVVMEGEEKVDDKQVEDLIAQKTKNALYSLFIKAKNWDEKHHTVVEEKTLRKRKCGSPELGTPSRMKPRQNGSSPNLRPRANSVVALPGTTKRQPRSRRNKSESLPKGQPLLTSMWPKEKKK